MKPQKGVICVIEETTSMLENQDNDNCIEGNLLGDAKITMRTLKELTIKYGTMQPEDEALVYKIKNTTESLFIKRQYTSRYFEILTENPQECPEWVLVYHTDSTGEKATPRIILLEVEEEFYPLAYEDEILNIYERFNEPTPEAIHFAEPSTDSLRVKAMCTKAIIALEHKFLE